MSGQQPERLGPGWLRLAGVPAVHRAVPYLDATDGRDAAGLVSEDALDMVNTFEEFNAACSVPAREPVYLDNSSTAAKFKKARMAFGLLLHPDKMVAKIVPHRGQ